MVTATVEVSGGRAQAWAAELQAVLAGRARPDEIVSQVQVLRDAGLSVAIIALVFAGVDTAKTIWDWWRETRPEETTVTILLADGTRIEVSGVSREELDALVQRAVSQR